ncbi:16S rRNA (cytosine(967)-C(5))-methyltransferase [Stenomitos frigidus ULC18]|uniref:16S rRNA (cytosine(967)-C(5))-methyltransferase n=1 Tax=Stenomitos frigidus ULC18 TaxID=2107698 RepID=A0A2T1E3L5_9CYAN|nr:16S rRNA (cytosine(967)-C(5))-methyltransferase [Stenomitos frigidus]PSB27327.1 16S rRNA (cytosine(967)-C(5))-methyltransferase [Stenomitos frigidus ULC18]
MSQNPRQLAFLALRSVHRGAFADVALDKTLRQATLTSLLDRRLLTELVYGSVRRQRTLDALIDQLAKKPAQQQPADLRAILHLGLYQLRYLNQIPASAAVNTTVDLAKQNGFSGLTGFVNGLLRQYIRLTEDSRESGIRSPESEEREAGGNAVDSAGEAAGNNVKQTVVSHTIDPLSFILYPSPADRLGVLHSYPDWMVKVWLEQLGLEATEQLCQWMNQPPHIDIRVNTLRASVETVEEAMQGAGIAVSRVAHLPAALRLPNASGSIQQLPGFAEGWWIVQDSSAQLVGYLLDPQPKEVVVDACAAPGGKTMHIAELMHDRGTVWACDRAASRLKKLQQNVDRLGLHSIQLCEGDSRNLPQFIGQGDRVLVDAPCSGLGTLHRHADARWRQTPETVQQLTQLQAELLEQAALWVKPDGILVYATCTLHPAENEAIVQGFLQRHTDWAIEPPQANSPPAAFATDEGWLKVWSHQHDMDGFFMARLKKR